jgi:hypothetical protein
MNNIKGFESIVSKYQDMAAHAEVWLDRTRFAEKQSKVFYDQQKDLAANMCKHVTKNPVFIRRVKDATITLLTPVDLIVEDEAWDNEESDEDEPRERIRTNIVVRRLICAGEGQFNTIQEREHKYCVNFVEDFLLRALDPLNEEYALVSKEAFEKEWQELFEKIVQEKERAQRAQAERRARNRGEADANTIVERSVAGVPMQSVTYSYNSDGLRMQPIDMAGGFDVTVGGANPNVEPPLRARFLNMFDETIRDMRIDNPDQQPGEPRA